MATLALEKPLPRGDELPYSDGEPLESDWHVIAMNLLIQILRYFWWERDDRYVAGNMFVYFDPHRVKNRHFRGPDVFVAKGVQHKNPRKSWVVWEEQGIAPAYVIELASESTLPFDLGGKKDIYERELKTPEYIVYDPATQTLRGWRLDNQGRYRELKPDARAWLWSKELGLWLGTAEYQVGAHTDPITMPRFFDADGKLLPTKDEAEAQRARIAEQRADTAERRAATAEQRADTEKQRAATAEQRADTEKQRAEAEAQTRRAAEAELVRLKALLDKKT